MESGGGNFRRSCSPSHSPTRNRTRSPHPSFHPRHKKQPSWPNKPARTRSFHRRDGRTNTHLATAEKIRREGRVAIIPCQYCFDSNVICYVGSVARRCAACARAGRMVEKCGVNREEYREIQFEEEETSESPSRASVSDDKSSGLRGIEIRPSPFTRSGNRPTVAGTASFETSIPQDQVPSPTVDDKLNEIREYTTRGFGRISREADKVGEKILVLEDTIVDLQTRVKSLEEMVLYLAANHRGSRT